MLPGLRGNVVFPSGRRKLADSLGGLTDDTA
jgi:hypothetical protein